MSAKLFQSLVLATGMAFLAGSANATTIGYWQFQDGIAGANAGSVATQTNGPTLNGTAAAAGGPVPKFDASVVGPKIRDGIGGAIINANNSTSLLFDNTGGINSGSGGVVTVADPGGPGSLLKPASFTVEGFMKVIENINFPLLVGKDANNPPVPGPQSDTSWTIDTSNTEKLRARTDNLVTFNQGIGEGTSPVLNDGLWHHFAATYDGTTRDFRLYVDYIQTAQATLSGGLFYDDTALRFGQGAGGRAFDGLLDEIRLSDQVLTTNQFLRAVPEPNSLSMMLFGIIGLWLMGRKRGAR